VRSAATQCEDPSCLLAYDSFQTLLQVLVVMIPTPRTKGARLTRHLGHTEKSLTRALTSHILID
jgi:hypothetical protein